MSTYRTTWSCSKCGITIPTVQRNAGFLYGYGKPKDGPCPNGGNHDWYEIVEGTWSDD